MMPAQDSAVKRYIQAAIGHGEATERGDYKAANRQHDRIIKALRDLRTLPGGERETLIELLDYESPFVRSWAATYLLFLEPNRAIATLEKLASMPGFLGFDAKVTLAEFHKGTLKLL